MLDVLCEGHGGRTWTWYHIPPVPVQHQRRIVSGLFRCFFHQRIRASFLYSCSSVWKGLGWWPAKDFYHALLKSGEAARCLCNTTSALSNVVFPTSYDNESELLHKPVVLDVASISSSGSTSAVDARDPSRETKSSRLGY